MCLVIDTCCLADVFNADNAQHADFVPILKWIWSGNGRMIYGGTKYAKELGMMKRKVYGMMTELEKKHHLVKIDTSMVDTIADALKNKIQCATFNDEHIVALVIASKCRVVCTNDKAAMLYLKRSDVYAEYRLKRPRIYRRQRDHVGLCCDQNIVPICR